MASKLLIVLVLGVAVQSAAANPAPGLSDWFAQMGQFFENVNNVGQNIAQHAEEDAGQLWQDVVDSAQQEAQQVGSWIQNAYNETAAAWSNVQEQLQASAQKAIVSAQQGLISAGQQVSQDASQWVQEAASNLQNAISSISTKSQENFEKAKQFVEAGEAALEKLQDEKVAAGNQIIQSIANNFQQGLNNVQSLLNQASAEVNNSTSS